MDTFVEQPALKHRDREMIPRVLLRAMAGLVVATLVLVSFAVLTDRPPVGSPAPSAVVQERVISLIGGGAQAVTVLDENGAVLADMAHGGFVTVVQNALETARRRHGVDPDLPVRLVRYENGRLAVLDPIIGWSVELYAFGADNKAAFERLLTQ
jgi:putative photosynthetic complex assembly protein